MKRSADQELKPSLRPERLTTLLLDLDGTLLYSSPALPAAFAFQALARLRPSRGLWRSLRAMRSVRRALERRSETSRAVAATNWVRSCIAMQTVMACEELSEAASLLAGVYQNSFAKLRPLFRAAPGMESLGAWAKERGLRLVLATNPIWTAEVTLMRLHWAGLRAEDFYLLTHAENMHYIKPDPRYYQELLARLGCAPHECLMVGNDRRKDGCATQVGIAVALVRRPAELSALLRSL